MSGKEMRPLSLSIGASLLPSFSLVTALNNGIPGKSCHGKMCHPLDEYCSTFLESCEPCINVCDNKSHNYQAETCAKECSDFNRYEPLKAEIHDIQSTQHLILLLLTILLVLIALRCLFQCLRWTFRRRSIQRMLQRLQAKAYPHPHAATANGKDLNATTIQNLNAINRHHHGSDIEQAHSQIYSVAGVAEGSVLTMTTPVSTRYPAENSTTPTTIISEVGYGYDNQAMVVTPVSEKPSNNAATSAVAF
ncbi:hypothetical protein KR054_010961 [Drosophila jambulina]|nr:hypothetical protein KR054_010961 [Drosophila jambulina]